MAIGLAVEVEVSGFVDRKKADPIEFLVFEVEADLVGIHIDLVAAVGCTVAIDYVQDMP